MSDLRLAGGAQADHGARGGRGPQRRLRRGARQGPRPDARGDEPRAAARRNNFDYVGDRFAREARRIHNGDAEERGIYGEASRSEVEALVDEGVPVAPLPPEAPKKSEIN